MSAPLLSVRDLVKHYPIRKGLLGRTVGQVRALDGVSFEVAPGEVFSVVGESGSGKSTLGRCILRLEEPTSGAVTFDGRDLLALKGGDLRRVRKELQVVFQDPYGSLNPRMTVGAAVEEPLIIHRAGPGAERRRRVAELLERVGLGASDAAKYPHEFSGGQRQRVGIARALALNPKFLLLDEPVSALDVSVQAQVLNLLDDLRKEFGLAYLFIAHGLAVVEHVSDRVAVMYLGRFCEEGPAAALFSDPLHPYTKALLAASPEPDPTAPRGAPPLTGEIPSPAAPPPGCRFHTRCPLAVARCREELPALREVGPGRRVSCHFV